ncbi:MAG: carboxypeptidase-like regulatory domain-containing protein [Planctomycetaceae bacterium]|jgi:hypothetical protein|nr:carboxypeptidase-like regulatory domain-containing protein [Planctomycetaceae bacterium]
MNFKKIFCSSILVLLGIIPMVIGCDNSAPANVTGTVTLDGKPLPRAKVIFSPVDGSRSSIGVTDSQGKYKLRFSASTQGATVGEHKVEIRTTPTESDSSVKIKPVEIVPARYNKSTELKQTLKKGTQVINFDLSSQ